MKKQIIICIAALLMFLAIEAQGQEGQVYGPYVVSVSDDDTLTVPALFTQFHGPTNGIIGYWVTLFKVSGGVADSKHMECVQILALDETAGLVNTTAFSAATGPGYLLITPTPPYGARIRRTVTATKTASGVAPQDAELYLTNSADTSSSAATYVRSHIDDLESDADSIEAAAQYNRSHIDDLESDADTTELAVQFIRGFIEDLESDADTTELAAQFIRGFIEDLESDADTTELAAQFIRGFIEDLESDADTTELAVQFIRGFIEDLESDADSIESAVQYNRSHIDDLESDADSIEAAVQYNRSHIDDLESDADTTELAVQFIRGFIEDIESDADTTELAVQFIRGFIEDLESDADTAVVAVQYVRSHIDDLESDADSIEAAVQYNRSHMDDLESDADTCEVAIQYVRSHTDDLESDADTCEAAIQQIRTWIARAPLLGDVAIQWDSVSTPDAGGANWSQAAHRLFTVTGECAVKVIALCDETLVGAATLEVGVAGSTGSILAQVANATTLAAGDFMGGRAASTVVPSAYLESDWMIVSGTDIDLLVGAANVTDGILRFRCVFAPLPWSAGATVARAAWD